MRLENIDIGKSDSSKRAVVQAHANQRVVVCRDDANEPLVMGIIDPNFPMAEANCFQLEYRIKGLVIKQYLIITYSNLGHMALVRRF